MNVIRSKAIEEIKKIIGTDDEADILKYINELNDSIEDCINELDQDF